MKPSDSSRRGRSHALLEELSPERRQLLERLLEKERAKRSAASISRVPRGEGGLPASDAQRRLWFLWQLDPSDTSYNECLAARLDGALEVSRLKRAILALLGRHEVLRSVFEEVDGDLVQRARDVSSLELEPVEATEREARTESDRLRDEPFDLSTGPLFRVKLFRIAPESHVLAIALHHVVADGWSQGVFLRELGVLYEVEELPPLPIQYGDYAAWQKRELSSERLAGGIAFWKTELANASSRDLPYDWTRGTAPLGPARALDFPLDDATASGIGRVSKDLGATPFMLVSAAVAGVLARLTGEPDRTFGTPFAGRTRAELEGLIGFFLNLLPIRVNIQGDPTFGELVALTRDATIRAIQHQEVPFEQIIDAVRPERDLTRTPLFQILVNSPELESKSLRVGDLRVELLAPETDHAKYDLTLYLESTGEGGLRLRAVYRADLFRPESIRELGNEIVRCLSRGCLEPQRPVSELVLPRDVAAEVRRRLEGRDLPTPVAPGGARIQRRRESRHVRCERVLARAPRFALVIAAWSLVVARRAGVTDAVVGAALGAGSPLPLIVDAAPELELATFVAQVEQELTLLRRLPSIPSWALRTSTDGGAHPFDSVVAESARSPARPLELSVQPTDATRLVLEFDDDVYDEAEANALLDQVVGLVECFEREPALRIGEIDLARFAPSELLPDPRIMLVKTTHEPVLDRIARVVETTPNAVAIRQHGRDHSYAELWLNAHAISERLVKSGVRSQMAIAVRGRQSFDLFSAWLAVLQRNAILVTLDPSLPERRSEHMQSAAGVELVLCVDAAGHVEIHRSQRSSERRPASTDAAYVFFTSGTTGLPKGVLGTHPGLSHFLDWQRREFGIGPGHRAAQLTGLSFDVVLRSVFLPLTSGATLCLPESSSELGGDSVLSFLAKERISFAHVVPTLAASWLASAPGEIRCVKRLFFAGEPLLDSLVNATRRVFPNAEIVNLYGPTETTLAKCFSRVGAELRRGAQAVGRPLPNTQALVLSRDNTRTAGVGELGEVVIRTPFRTLGYVNAPQESEARFVPNPFRNDADDLFYLTGDRGYFLADGSLALAGRSDDQIKIWGVRVEPAEVARTLREHPSVDDAFVGVQPDDAAGSRLVAWVAARVPMDPRDLVRFLEPILPAVMIPKSFVILDRLPVNASGKVDRSRLPAPVTPRVHARVAPRTPLEEQVASIFAELLGAKDLGAEDDFFHLGGHSLLAVRAANRLSQSLGVGLSLRQIFEQPSVAGVAASIEALLAEGKRHDRLRLVPRNRTGDVLPLSFSEERLWFIDQLDPGSSAYNIHACFRVRGALRVDALTNAIRSVVDRHESLRTSFPNTAGVPERRIHEHASWDGVRISEADEASLRNRLRHEVRRPFDLATGPLIRFVIANLAPDHHVVCFVVHHVVADGWSLLLLVRELIGAYSGAPRFPELPIQYADFAAWQRESVDIAHELSHFEKSLSEIEPLDLPLDHPRPAVLGDRGNRVAVALTPALSERARELASSAGVTPFMLFFSLLGVLVGRLSGQKRFAIGFPIAGRTAQETDGVVGFFANTLVAPIDLDGAPSFAVVLERTKRELLGAYAHQHAPFEKLVAALEPERNTSRSPVFQAIFALQESFDVPSAPGLELETFELDPEIARFDLSLVLQERAGRFAGHLDLNADLFDRETAVAWAEHFPRVLEQVLLHPDSPIGRLDLVDPSDRNRLLGELSGTPGVAPRGTLLERITEVARTHPERTALVSDERSVDYRELVRASTRLAGRLIDAGVEPESRVAIGIERSVDFVIAALAVWRAGGAYVPIDPSLPRARAAHMLADSDAVAWITREKNPELEELGVPLVGIDETGAGTPGRIEPQHAAYVIYTSGSTGQPKGVVIEHASVASTIAAMVEAWDIRAESRVLAIASPSFDASVLETFTALSSGATLFVPSREQAEPGEPLARYVRENDIHFALIVPSVLGVMPHDLALRTLVVGGEACSRALIEPFARHMRVVNAYGPTEVSIAATQGELLSGAEVTIGRPLSRSRVYVLDAQMQPVLAGIFGELYVGGAGVGRGYARMPALTAERFVPDPFSGVPGTRLYRTGDRCRFQRDGRLEFGGRLDSQIKLRGFRIELGEIESRLVAHPDVRQAAVVVREDVPGMKQLVAYLVTASEALPANLTDWLLALLPAHMLPSAFVRLESLPTNASGKLDQRKLPRPLLAGDDESSEPGTENERKLCAIVKGLLGLTTISIHDRFFALGGDSISSVQLVARARREGLSFSVRDVFDAPNLAALALRSRAASPPGEADEPAPTIAPLTAIQRWFFQQKLENRAHFNQSLWLEVDSRLDDDRVEAALQKLVDHHASLRTRFSGGTQSTILLEELPEWFCARKGGDLERIANEAQLGLDLEKGPVFRATLVAESGGRRLLFLVAHHLVVDGVSWRILADDLVAISNALVAGASVELDSSALSFLGWATRVARLEKSLPIQDELSHWRDVLAIEAPALPRDRANGRIDYASAKSVSVSLSPEASHALLRGALLAHRIEPGELLLAALVSVISRWTNSRRVRLDVERHGRDAHGADVDTTRTVGWFTALFPFAMHVPVEEAGVEELLLAVKREWRSVPRSGTGYGMLRYGPASAELGAQPGAEVVFNYLGQVASEAASSSTLLALAHEPTGKHQDPASLRPYLLEVNALFVAGQLRLTLGFSQTVHDERTIEALANELARSVEELTRACGQPDSGRLHALDFPAYRGDQRSLDLFGERLRARARDEGKNARRAFEDIEDIYALSPLQAGMLFDTLHSQSSGMYVEQIVLELEGALDESALERAFQDLVDRHAILRTRFEWEGFDEPVQIVQRTASIQIHRAGCAEDYVPHDRETPFELSRAPLARVALFRHGPSGFLLVVTHHHILLDGWSTGRAIAELMHFYEARVKGRSVSLPAPLRFRDYVSWIQNRNPERDEAHWREVLQGVDEPTRLACDRGPSARQSGVERRSLELTVELSAAIRTQARSESVTESALVHAAWALVLGAHSGSRDVVFGTVVSGRPAELPEVESAVGLFLNTVPLRVRISAELSVRDLLRRVQAHMRDIQEHAHFPLSRLRALSSVPNNVPPFETAVAFESYPAAAAFSTEKLRTVAVRRQEEASVPFALLATPGERVSLVGQFAPGRFDPRDVEALLEHVARCLEWMTRDVDAKLSGLSLLDAKARADIARVSTGPRADEPGTLHGMVEETARRHPHVLALAWTGGSLDYAELDARSKRLAAHLTSLGVRTESRVAVRVERSADYVVAALAVLRAGAAFVPIDPVQPPERQRFMLDDSGASLVIDQNFLADVRGERSVRLPEVRPEHAAYVIYTSGSTGRPKGVVIEHRGVTNTVRALRPSWGLEPGMRSTFIASTSFDSSLIEMFVPLTSGATLCVPNADERRPGHDLAAYLERNAIDLTLIVPSMLGAMPDQLPVRTLVTGGEASTPRLLAPFLRRQKVLNVYGPTEISVVSAAGPILADDDVTLGTPLAGTDNWVLDEDMRLVPIGVFGELYVGGAGLARSYLGRPDLTAERFVPHPYAKEPGARLYRTGDRCRYRRDGRIDFAGRLDTQVKLRGFRIELQEIEAALEAETSVRRAVVVVREDVPGVERLVAYLDLVEPKLEREELLTKLAARLPAHMLPSAFVPLATFPLTASGKVDRKKLPAPPLERETEEPKPRTAAEQAIATLFEELLGVRDVRLADDFFARGGHSLLATRFVARLRRSLGVELPLKALFDAPTVEGIAASVARLQNEGIAHTAIERIGRKEAIPLSFAQERIWFLQQLAPTSPAYNVPAVVRLSGPLDTDALARALEKLVERHEILRTTYSDASGAPLARVHTSSIELRTATLEGDAELELALERETRQPFDLVRELPLRALLVRRADDEHVLCLTLHHIACDGWSAGVLVDELTRSYAGAELDELPIQYADYAAWQRTNDDHLERELAYWVERLGTDPEPLHLPLDRPRPPRQSYAGASIRHTLPSELSTRIDALARRSSATLFSLLLAGLSALLAKASGDRRIIIGSPVANRARPEAEQLIGVFLNTLAIVCEVDDDPTFDALVARARDGVLGALAHQEVPFERVLEAIRPTRDASRTPVFQVMLNLAPAALVTRSVGDLRIEPIALEDVSAKFDLTLYVSESEQGLSFQAVYARELFDPESVSELLSSLESLFEQVTKKPELRVSELELVLPEGGYEAAAVEHFRRMFRAFTGATRLGPRRGQLATVEDAVSFEGSPSHAHAAWALVVSRHTGADDAPFAIASSDGPFPFRVAIDQALGARSFVARVDDLLRQARRFVAIRPDVEGARLFDSLVCEEGASLPDTDVALVGSIQGRELRLSYDTARFSEAQARALLEQWAFVSSQLARSPHVLLGEVSLVTDAARPYLPDPRLHIHRVVYPSVATRIAQRAQENPAAVAVRQGERKFTYGELSRAARGVAARLAKDGVAPGDVIGIGGAECFGRVVALVGALGYGAVVVPVDEKLPTLRRERMLQEAHAKLVLTLDDADALSLGVHDLAEPPPLPPDSPAYVFFTSGTTGTPKGVLGRHNGLAHFLDWQSREFGVGASDRTGQLTSFSFDVVLRAILLPLVSGAALCLPETPDVRVLDWLKREKISLLHLVPTLAEAWLADAEPDLALPEMRVLFFAGEPLGDSLVARYRKLCPNAEIVNLYGPTETTLAKCFARVPLPAAAGAQAVGRSMPGTQALVLVGKRLCGIGEPGDVVIRTPHRSLGYLNATDENQKKFVQNPFGTDPDDLVYLTGDRGQYLPDGSLQLLGRSDEQTKLWGVRVEPQEIASALAEHPLVQSAFVTAYEGAGVPRLVAYVVARASIDPSALIAHASQRLPSAVVPTAFVFLPALPVGSNGKIDRSRLPVPELATTYEAPRTHAEETIARVWQEVLGVERVGIRDGFFGLGGHSLLAARAVARIRELLGIELPVRALFEHATVEALARHIGEQRLSELDESELGALLDAIEGES